MSEREELAKALRRAYYAGYYGDDREPLTGIYDDMSERDKRAYLAEADVALARCARVPAEVWALPAKLRERAKELDTLSPSDNDRRSLQLAEGQAVACKLVADELEAALKSTGQDAQMPPRVAADGVAVLRDVVCDLRDVSADLDAIRREFPDASPRFQVTLGEANAIRTAIGPGGCSDVVLCDIINYELDKRPAEQGGQALRLACETTLDAADESLRLSAETAGITMSAAEPAPRALPTRESIAERLRRDWQTAYTFEQKADYILGLLREHASPADEALRAKLDRADAYIKSLEALGESQCDIAASLRKDLDKAERERDEALAVWEAERDEAYKNAERLRAEVIRAGEACAEASAQLAARPEPVVLDEALAERLAGAMWGESVHFGRSAPTLLDALRSVLGEKVSVAPAPFKCTDDMARAANKKFYEYCEESWSAWKAAIEAAVADGGGKVSVAGPVRMHSDACDEHLLQLERERDKLRAEMQAAQEQCAGAERFANEREQELEAKHAKLVEVADKLRAVRKEHETLRAAAERVAGLYSNAQEVIALRALLKPTTPEAQAEPSVHVQRFADPQSGEPRYRVLNPDGVPASLAPLTAREAARLDRVEAALRHCLKEWSSYRTGREALAMLDTGKQEVGK